jgi:hypothetical protein
VPTRCTCQTPDRTRWWGGEGPARWTADSKLMAASRSCLGELLFFIGGRYPVRRHRPRADNPLPPGQPEGVPGRPIPPLGSFGPRDLRMLIDVYNDVCQELAEDRGVSLTQKVWDT